MANKNTMKVRARRQRRRAEMNDVAVSRLPFNMVPISNTVHRFVDTLAPGTIAGAATNPPYTFAESYTLGGSPNAASYAALFQQYRIVKVEKFFCLNLDSVAAGAGSATAGWLPRFVTVFDPNDATVPASEVELLSYDNVKINVLSTAQPTFTRVFAPKPQVAVQGVNVGQTTAGLWLNTSNTSVPFYGLKIVMVNNANVSLTVAAYTRVHYEFRYPK